MSTSPVTLRIRWTKLRQIQPPPPIAQDQYEIVDHAQLEKRVDEHPGVIPPVGADYVIDLGGVKTSEHKVEKVDYAADRTTIYLSDFIDFGVKGRDELAAAGFTES